jgi:replicative DNA helicase
MKAQTPPYNKEAEESILATCISCSAHYKELDICSADFFIPKNRTIAAAIEYLDSRGESYDKLTLKNYLCNNNKLDKIGGAAYLTELTEEIIPSTQLLKTHAGIIRDAAWRRSVADAARQAYIIALDPHTDIVEAKADIEKAILPALSMKTSNQKRMAITKYEAQKHLDVIEKRTRHENACTGIPTGYEKLDFMTGGLQPSELIIIAARPSMGKTSLAVNVILHNAHHGMPSLIFSLEMSTISLMDRKYAALADLNLLKIRNGQLTERDWQKMTRAAGMLSDAAPILIDDTSALPIIEIRSRARRAKAEYDIGLIVVDYLQLIRNPQKSGSREQEISLISQELKAMAKELYVPVLALSQLNRSCENRTNKRPQLSDIRDSGAIEQDADLIMFIYQDEFYNRDTDDKGIAEIIIGKQRNGPNGVVRLAFEGETTKFSNLI